MNKLNMAKLIVNKVNMVNLPMNKYFIAKPTMVKSEMVKLIKE
jgi:hypothetical protein